MVAVQLRLPSSTTSPAARGAIRMIRPSRPMSLGNAPFGRGVAQLPACRRHRPWPDRAPTEGRPRADHGPTVFVVLGGVRGRRPPHGCLVRLHLVSEKLLGVSATLRHRACVSRSCFGTRRDQPERPVMNAHSTLTAKPTGKMARSDTRAPTHNAPPGSLVKRDRSHHVSGIPRRFIVRASTPTPPP